MTGNRREIDIYASRQYGVFNTSQARAAGFDRSAVSRRCSSGEWIRICPNVFVVASAAPKWERTLAAAVLSRPHAVVGGVSAAYLHGLRGGAKARPVIVVPDGGNARSPIAKVVRHSNFEEIETESVLGFTVTSISETIVLLARQISPQNLESAFDDALISGKLNLGSLDRVLDREFRSCAPGMARIRELADSRSPVAPTIDGSYLERLTEMLFRKGGLVGWKREFPMSIDGARSRVDFLFVYEGVVVESDGRSWHLRARDFEVDRQRDNALLASGRVVLRFTYQMLRQEPDRCLATVARVLSERRAFGGGEHDSLHRVS